MQTMKESEFNLLANELFGSVLLPLGFTNQGTQHCTFYRKVGEEVYHFIMPSMGSRRVWYQVHVFPHSPAIYPLFEHRFPDNLGIPTDRCSLLSEYDGVNVTQQQFHCKYEEGFRRGFTRTVQPLLLNAAVPYLDQFQTVADIIPVIRHPSFLGFALHHVGRSDEAIAALQRERERLKRLDTDNVDVATLLEHVDQLLGQEA